MRHRTPSDRGYLHRDRTRYVYTALSCLRNCCNHRHILCLCVQLPVVCVRRRPVRQLVGLHFRGRGFHGHEHAGIHDYNERHFDRHYGQHYQHHDGFKCFDTYKYGNGRNLAIRSPCWLAGANRWKSVQLAILCVGIVLVSFMQCCRLPLAAAAPNSKEGA